MRILKLVFRITPLRLSFIITCLFMSVSIIYDSERGAHKLIATSMEKGLDYKFKVRGQQSPKSKIFIVAADEKSFQKFGQWPFDREAVIAPMIDTICKYNPKVLAFDGVWSEPERTVSAGVRKALAQNMQARGESLDDFLSKTSGDAAMSRAITACKDKIILGYAIELSSDFGLQKDEFEKRANVILANPKNKLFAPQKFLNEIQWSSSAGSVDGFVHFYQTAKSGLLNVPAITSPELAQASFNNEQDPDGNIRHGQLFFEIGRTFGKDSFIPSLALRMAQKILSPGDEPAQLLFKNVNKEEKNEEIDLQLGDGEGKRKIPVDHYGKVLINFRGPQKTFGHISIADILSPSDAIEYQINEGGELKTLKKHKSELLKDAILIFGVTANAIYDVRPQPFDEQQPGVENHANILDTILSNEYISPLSGDLYARSLIIIFVLSMLYGFAQSKLSATSGALFGFSVIAGLLWFDQYYLFNRQRIFFPGHIQAFQLLLQYISITVFKYATEESEKKFIRSAFDKYVSPAVINSMLKDPGKLQLGGDKKELSIMFSDIRGFTTLSEKLDVKTLTLFLNEYLGAMTEILQTNKGTLDKYIGDAVMGFWGAPLELADHAELAVKSAVEMMQKLDSLNAEFKKKYDITIDIGIGINSGPVSVGNFGSNKVFEYTVIGDNVNLASRLEGINKFYGTHVIISETTYALLKPGQFLTREVDTVKVKGKQKPVKIYEVFPDNAAHKPLKDSLKTFNEGLANYYQRKFEQALTFFQTVLKSRESDRPSMELIDRCKYYLTSPPPSDWDGSWEMHEK